MKKPTAAEVHEKLRGVKDPEIGLDIITLGLVYGVDISDDNITVRMTLTTPGCPLTGYFTREVQKMVLSIPAVEDVVVDFVLDPPWDPSMIDKSVRFAMGV